MHFEGNSNPETLRYDLRNKVRLHREIGCPESLAQIAWAAYKAEKLKTALYFAKKSLDASNNECSLATLTVARVYLKNRLLVLAFRNFKQLLTTQNEIQALIGLGEIFTIKRKYKAHLHILDQLDIKFSNNYQTHAYFATVLLRKNDFIGAWQRIHKCIELNSDCMQAWELAYECANKLKQHDRCLQIAEKLISLDPEYHYYYSLLGSTLDDLNLPIDSCKAFKKALELYPRNAIYLLNSLVPCHRVPLNGSTAQKTASLMKKCAIRLTDSQSSQAKWSFKGSFRLSSFAFYIAYSPINLRLSYEPYLDLLLTLCDRVIIQARTESATMKKKFEASKCLSTELQAVQENSKGRRIRLGLISRYFYSHSNSQAFEGFFKFINRSLFEIVIIHEWGTKVDNVQLRLNSRADEVVYLSQSIAYSHFLLSCLEIDILFFTDIGMSAFDFIIPELRCSPIQITGWGLPHTSGLRSIDYYLSSSLIENISHQAEYTEKLVLLDGLPCCYLTENLYFRARPKEYFLLPDDSIAIGCIQSLHKIHPDLDLILERVARRLPHVLFVFVSSSALKSGLDQAFISRLSKRAPTAFKRTLLLERCSSSDFLSLCNCLDIILDTPYYGAGVTAYMSMYTGTPTVCFKGKRLRDSMTSTIYQYLNIDNAPIATNIPDYTNTVCKLATNADLRLSIKQDTINAAHLLYDNCDYIRSFESFCMDIMFKHHHSDSIT